MPSLRRLGSLSWLRASALGLASLLAMRDDMGVYAAEALQSQEEGSAYSALERQARARPPSGASRTATFATPTSPSRSSYEDALALAGRPVADQWAQVRQAEGPVVRHAGSSSGG